MGLSNASVVRRLGFLKLHFVIADALENAFCIISPNFMEIYHTVTQITRFFAIGCCLVKCKNLLRVVLGIA